MGQLIGLVLCGGKSARMGKDKGTIIYEGNPWVKIASDKLSKLRMNVVISVNQLQKAIYQALLPDHTLVIDLPSQKVKGPMLGILSTHLAFPEDDIFILACDLLLINEDLLKEIYDAYNNRHNIEVILCYISGEPEPMCGIYKVDGLRKIHNLFTNKETNNYSIKGMLECLHIHEINLTEKQSVNFKNFNDDKTLRDVFH